MDTPDASRESRPAARPAPKPAQTGPAGGPFTLYKPNQGTYVRWGTAAGAGVLALFGGVFLRGQLRTFAFPESIEFYVINLVPVVFWAGMAYLIFWAVGRNERLCEFMIATEGEMKKVNWSTRREIFGATRVVIFTVFALGLILAIVDLFFIVFFSGIGVLRMHILENLFGPGNQV